MKKYFISVVILIAAASYSRSLAATSYNLTCLSNVSHIDVPYFTINDNRQIIGGSGNNAFLWDNGNFTDLGTLNTGEKSGASSINNSGLIAGSSYFNGDLETHAVIWKDGVIIDIDRGDMWGGHAVAVNDKGQVLVDTWGLNPYIWQNGQITDLGNIGRVTGMNDQGDIIGYSDVGFLIKSGVKIDLGTLNGNGCIPWAINNLDQVVGNAGNRAFIWDEINGAADLGTVTVGRYPAWAYSINDKGQVVGEVSGTGFLWENGVMTNLNDLTPAGSGVWLGAATGINNNGDIVGMGFWPNPVDPTNDDLYEPHPYLLTAVPEPCTISLLSIGTLLLRKRFA